MHSSQRAADELCEGLDRFATAAPSGLQNFSALLVSTAPGKSACTLAQSKALIGVAMAVAQRCDCCIENQIRSAVRSRIDRSQIVIVLRRAILMADGPAIAYGAYALGKFDVLSAQLRGTYEQSRKETAARAPSEAPEEESDFARRIASG